MALELLLAAALLGAAALLIHRRALRRERQAERAFPPTGQLIGPAGRRIHAHVEGAGRDVVLIHGASGNTRDFTHDLVGRLARDYRVTAFDRPGLGWSDDLGPEGGSPAAQARALRAAASQLGLLRPIIVGHSYGGAVAMAWALDEPEGVDAVVLLGGATMPWPGGLGIWYALTSSWLGRALVVPLVTAFAPHNRIDEAMRVVFEPDPVPQGYGRHFAAGLTLRRKVLAENARQVNELRPHVVDMSARYHGMTLPVEIVHGTADTIVPAEIHARPLARILPDAVLTLIEGVGHMPHHAAPEDVVAAIHRAAERAALRRAS
ncbi:alpha/beta hydrolase [Tabrizicola sp. J26]|uniref:alpha/beta fold hydrolase n=1 Tax=Alitabrizicola rongguiensis TaxID=2909234 RepID=UPI001F1D10F7|nr:alpha/beta hydrolase [Tabrizicola rongguiensis]MCF1709786.1 alpha/beta hydrolase [Tabrizicola rongguiensis]